jgi:DNA-binding PadR family transcriptional regulator
MKRSMLLLPQISLSILVALSLRPRHGYEIMQQVEEDSAGRIKLVPGALYSSIKNLLDAGLIREVPPYNERRRYYGLTPKGTQKLAAEMEYFKSTLDLTTARLSQDQIASL